MSNLKTRIEHHQIYIYFIALILGTIAGMSSITLSNILDYFVTFFIAILMFSMFSQIPFSTIKNHFLPVKYIIALVISNFFLIPILVYGLIHLFNITSLPILIGLYLVLLTPCIDYVIVFTALGKGNAQYMLISTPILFILQILLLPFYCALFLNSHVLTQIDRQPFLEAFLTFIVLPLIFAILLQLFSGKFKPMQQLQVMVGWLPELFMAFVLFTVVGSQINTIIQDLSIVLTVIPIYLCFMMISPCLGVLCGKLFRLDVPTLRTLAFSNGTRNALVVLPLALSLPNQWVTIATTVIVTQTLTELFGELVYIKLIPKFIK